MWHTTSGVYIMRRREISAEEYEKIEGFIADARIKEFD